VVPRPSALGLCSVSEAKGDMDTELDIAALNTTTIDDPLDHWRVLIGRPPHPVHEEGPPHYGAKAGNGHTALPQFG
jgi:hypothetical protein